MRALRPGWLAWALWGLGLLVLAAAGWLDYLLRQSAVPGLEVFDAASLPVTVAHVGLTTIGALVASRRPGNPVGWLILTFGVLGQGSIVISGYADYGLLAHPGSLPAARQVASFFPADAVLAFASLALALLLTPTGSLPSARWRPWAALTVVIPAGLLLTLALTPAPARYQHLQSPFDLDRYGGAQLLAYQIALSGCPPGHGRGRPLAGHPLPPGRRHRTPATALGIPRGRPGRAAARRVPGRAGGWRPVAVRPGARRHGVPGDPDAGHRRRHPGIQAVRPGPHHQPHAGLRPAHGAARRWLRRGGRGAEPAGQRPVET